ncbi:MAG: 3-deoxy-D-manno-octulosonic acid transferase, partial [Firmicutes bacterium]|nr:3-deoxy-D-manno-octulosonic acid transferase [Bacillota bacterium]
HVTTGTEAGMELLARKQTQWGVTGGAFPLDDPKGLQPFLQTKPGAFLALETELWPNLLRELQRCDVPRLIVNGRLTARSLERGGPWMRRAASRLSMVAARDSESAERFRRLGAPRVDVGGNLKADLPAPAALHDGWKVLRRAWAEAPILVAGNTVEGEERAILTLWQRLREDFPSLRLLLAPRQPRRFEEVARLFSEAGLAFHRASQPWPDESDFWASREALLLDTLGELPSAYGEGTVALVGGGWGWHGGHNPLEPVRWGLPTFVGEGYTNFEDLVKPLREAGLLRVASFEALEQALVEQLRDAALRPGLGPAPSLPASLEGSLARTLALIEPFLPLPGKTEGTP